MKKHLKILSIGLILIGFLGPIAITEAIRHVSKDSKAYKDNNIKIIDTYESYSGVRSLLLALDLQNSALRTQLYTYLFGFSLCGLGVLLLIKRKIKLLDNEIVELRNQINNSNH